MVEQQGASGKKSQRDRGITTVTNKARNKMNGRIKNLLLSLLLKIIFNL